MHFVKISCRYLESEVQTFGVQNGLCYVRNFSIQESQRWIIFLNSVNDKQVEVGKVLQILIGKIISLEKARDTVVFLVPLDQDLTFHVSHNRN